jgi:hypothetical protein
MNDLIDLVTVVYAVALGAGALLVGVALLWEKLLKRWGITFAAGPAREPRLAVRLAFVGAIILGVLLLAGLGLAHAWQPTPAPSTVWTCDNFGHCAETLPPAYQPPPPPSTGAVIFESLNALAWGLRGCWYRPGYPPVCPPPPPPPPPAYICEPDGARDALCFPLPWPR